MGAALALAAAEIGATVAETTAVVGEAAAFAGEAAAAGAEAAEIAETTAVGAEAIETTEAAGLATTAAEEAGLGLTAEEAAIPEVSEFSSEFEAWYQSEFSEELEGIQSFAEPEPLPTEPTEFEFDITGDETLPDYIQPENVEAAVAEARASAAAAGGSAEAGANVGENFTGLTGFNEFPTPSGTTNIPSDPMRPIEDAAGPTQENLQGLRDTLHNILRNKGHSSPPEGFSWQDVIDQLQNYGWEFALSYFTKDEAKKIIKRVTEKILEKRTNTVKDVNDIIFLDPNGNVIPTPQLLKNQTSYIDPFRLGFSVGRITGHSIFGFTNNGSAQITEANLTRALIEGGKNYPQGHEVIPKLFAYISSAKEFRSPQVYQDEFTQIASVYNGDISEPFQLENGDWAVRDETGKVISQPHNDTGIMIPAIYGEYGGLLSPNKGPPRDYLDSLFFLHDYGYYDMGTFSKVEDMKLVSRISQNMDRFTTKERSMARFALLYFSHLGPVMQSFVKQKGTPSQFSSQSDIYDYLVPKNREASFRAGLGASGRRGQTNIRDQGRKHFFAGLEIGLDEAFREEAYREGLGPEHPRNNQAILEMFDNLVVVP